MSAEASTVSPISPENTEDDLPNVVSRIANLPLVNSTYDMVSSAYTSTKETHPYVKSICNVAEKGVKTITAAATGRAQPLLTKLEPQITTANEYACKGLDKLEDKLPILHEPSEKVVADAKELVSTKVTGAWNVVSGAKDVISKVVDVGKGALRGGIEITRSVVAGGLNTVRECRVCQTVASGLDTVLEKSERLVDWYLPLTDEELLEMARSIDDTNSNIAPVERRKEKKSYFVRLGSLSTKIRCRAYRLAVLKLQTVKENTQDGLALLHQTIDLIEYVKQGVDQKLQGGQEKLHQMFLEWSRNQTGSDVQSNSLTQPQVEILTLAMFQNLTHHLLLSCRTLMSSVHGLPASIQDKVQQVRHTVQDLHLSFVAAHSFQELPTAILVQSCERLAKARESLDEMLDYVVQNVPLPWLVGPFAPNLVELEEDIIDVEVISDEDEEDEDEEDVFQVPEKPNRKPDSPKQESSETKQDL